MRKVFAGIAAVLALGTFSTVSAEMSVGGGGFFASDFGGGFTSIKLKYAPANIDGERSVPWVGGGVNVFFDAEYAEISIGLTFAGGTVKTLDGGKEVKPTVETTVSATGLNIGVLGKYPIALNEALTVFPAVGIDYSLGLSGVSKTGDYETKFDGKDGRPDAADFSALWFKFGVGLDYNLTGSLFIRPALLYGIRLENKDESDAIKSYKDGAPSDAEIGSVLGHGLTVKVGVGFKL